MTAIPYLTTASGQRYRLVGPQLDTPRIGDIAHHLAQINRFTGAASRPYSVAEHSLLCEQIAASEGAGPMARLCALMHDAHEAYCSDMASPVKLALRRIAGWQYGDTHLKDSDFDEFESHHLEHISDSFGLTEGFRDYRIDVRRWDLIALATERRDLMPQDDGEGWAILDGVEPVPQGNAICPNSPLKEVMRWQDWRYLFLERFEELRALTL